MRLSFWGSTRQVTGANFLIEADRAKVLVDCGMIQGCHFCERRNLRPFPYDPKSIDAVVLTHAHIDHSGRLPKLVADGFSGNIFATPPTKDLSALLLEDSAGILADEAKERGGAPLFAAKDVPQTIERFEPLPYEQEKEIAPGVSVTLHDAGHVLGSAIVELRAQGKIFVFSGDLGNVPTSLLPPPAGLTRADVIIIESTYGDRTHEDLGERKNILEDALEETIRAGGTLLIPAFALERTQELLFELNALIEQRRIPRVPVFVDSPLAISATAIYKQFETYYNKEALRQIATGDEIFSFPGLRFTRTVGESKKINDVSAPKVIIAGSGMLTGGRILHHARRYLPDPKSTLLIIAYQAAGSLGRRIFDGAEAVKIFGATVPIRCRIKAIGGYSAHADQKQLVSWLDRFERPVKKVFAVHGEEGPALSLVQHARDHLGLDASAPMYGDVAEF